MSDSKYIELWDGLIVEINNKVEQVSKDKTESGDFRITIRWKTSIFPNNYGFGKDEELRDQKYKEIHDFLIKPTDEE